MKQSLVEGILEILPDGYGFLRNEKKNFVIHRNDLYIPTKMIQKFRLREGVRLSVEIDGKSANNQRPHIKEIVTCNHVSLEAYLHSKKITERTSIDPEERLIMTLGEDDRTGQLIDWITPIGKGQRGMIISPPKAGKTILLKHFAQAVLKNHPEVQVFILLVDERPEEVTDFQRALPGACVMHSSSDQDVENHLRITSLSMNMATRIVEQGGDVLILIDSLTRMGRAFNKDSYSGGKTLSGGLAANALELPRRFFGAARNIENGGSLTILATVLVETGSRMDEVIFQEFKGTGNLDLLLSRECAERRLYPAVNILKSGTRKDHKLLPDDILDKVNTLRRSVASMTPPEALQHLLEKMKK